MTCLSHLVLRKTAVFRPLCCSALKNRGTDLTDGALIQVSRAGWWQQRTPAILSNRLQGRPKVSPENPNSKSGAGVAQLFPNAPSKPAPSGWSLNKLRADGCSCGGRPGEADQGNRSPVLPGGLTTNRSSFCSPPFWTCWFSPSEALGLGQHQRPAQGDWSRQGWLFTREVMFSSQLHELFAFALFQFRQRRKRTSARDSRATCTNTRLLALPLTNHLSLPPHTRRTAPATTTPGQDCRPTLTATALLRMTLKAKPDQNHYSQCLSIQDPELDLNFTATL